MIRKVSFFDMVKDLYNEFPDERYCGTSMFLKPTLMLRDPKLIKQIAVKDFDHFVNHRKFVAEDVDTLWSKNLLSLRGEKWHEMRATLSPSFTSSKMKIMFTLIDECAENFSSYFQNKAKSSDQIEIDMKDTFTRFTSDVIASVAFGIKCDSINNEENDFFKMGSRLLKFSGFRTLARILILSNFPKLAKLLNLKMFSHDVREFFINVIKETIQTREEKVIYRPDMINLLLEARKGQHKQDENDLIDTGFATVMESGVHLNRKAMKSELTDLDIAAQAMIFFLAGFETVSSLMCLMSHELALHPEIQEKLQEEVDKTRKTCGGKLTYEALMGMKYLDMVISETLRYWPPAVASDRECLKPYVIKPEKSHEKPIRIEKGKIVWFPIIGIHRDEKYYSNPDVFDPERFSDENKKNIDPSTYIPFGVGPRNCIGSRFALLETKIIFYHMLSKLSFVTTSKTQNPLKFATGSTNLRAEKGYWAGLKNRS